MRAVVQRIASRASVTGRALIASALTDSRLTDRQRDRTRPLRPRWSRNRFSHVDFRLRADDTTKDAEALAKKILTLRLFNDESGQQMWRRSVKDIDGEILCGVFPFLQRLTKQSRSLHFTL